MYIVHMHMLLSSVNDAKRSSPKADLTLNHLIRHLKKVLRDLLQWRQSPWLLISSYSYNIWPAFLGLSASAFRNVTQKYKAHACANDWKVAWSNGVILNTKSESGIGSLEVQDWAFFKYYITRPLYLRKLHSCNDSPMKAPSFFLEKAKWILETLENIVSFFRKWLYLSHNGFQKRHSFNFICFAELSKMTFINFSGLCFNLKKIIIEMKFFLWNYRRIKKSF